MWGSARPSIAAGAAALGFAVAAGQAAAATCPTADWVVVEGKASAETRPVRTGPKDRVFVRRTPITTLADLTEIKLAGDAYDTQVQMKLTPDGARRLHNATTDRDGMRIAFVVGDRAISAVTWTGPYGMDAEYGVQLSLGGNVPQVRRIVASVQRCIGEKGR